MPSHEELFALAARLKGVGEQISSPALREPLVARHDAAKRVAGAFSNSWLGYHSRIYYKNLQPPPPGAHFSQEWGLIESFGDYGTRGDWCEFQSERITAHIDDQAGNLDLSVSRSMMRTATETFGSIKLDFLSIVEGELSTRADKFLERLKLEVEGLEAMSSSDVIQHLSPRGQLITRDMIALNQGSQAPAHMGPIAELLAYDHTIGICNSAAEKIAKVASHLERQARLKWTLSRVGTNVFIGHGRSLAWRELKDFVSERLDLPWDEFNRVPVAGVTNIARLLEMLDAAAIAFLIMTAEDEMADGATQARMNVIHEAGLFQGRLGFTRAIILLEEGCEEFSNIQGLGQIRFQKGNIAGSFEEIRRVLEREGVIEA